MSAHAPGGDPDQLATAVVRQMQHEYQDLDIARATETLAGHALEGYDFNFYCLDLTNTAMVRTVSTTNSIHLIFCQAEDREWERVEPIFAAITASLVRRLAPP
ncbi:MAG: hypothetical protein DWH79_03685 [Planctomycetota bacterium]|nr:MAG: hypothetical protein DWH79_03685 [Planctomycetota bacterium]